MNIVSPFFGGIPMCHGAGGMAGHIRFGAKTGGALVILGSLLMLIVAAFAMWNMGAAFVVGVVLDNCLRRGWIRI